MNDFLGSSTLAILIPGVQLKMADLLGKHKNQLEPMEQIQFKISEFKKNRLSSHSGQD